MKEAIQNLQDWWSLAGVDFDYERLPSSLLKERSAHTISESVIKPIPASSEKPEQAVAETVDLDARTEEFPDKYEPFLDWLKNPANLIETAWSRDIVYPDGCLEPQIMVISAMPEAGGFGDAEYYSANECKLLKNMLLAIGVKWEKSFRAALSLGRTIDGRLTENQMESLIDRTLHLISLVRPKRVIIFGDTASRAFFDEDLLTARKKKQFINHVSSKTEAIVTFHPRILLERPELKAESWKDLQMLTRIAK